MTAFRAAKGGVAFGPPLFFICHRAVVALTVAVGIGSLGLTSAEAEPVRVAIALPLTGPQHALGRQIKAAVTFALNRPDRTGQGPKAPLDASSLEVTWHDDKCSSDGGLAAAQAIVAAATSDRPHVVVGHVCPSAAQAAATHYNTAGIPFIAAGMLAARTTPTHRFGPKHFRLYSDITQGAAIGMALSEAGPAARIAFVRDRTAYAQEALSAAAAALAARGRPISTVETFAGADKDFAALGQRLSAAGITHMALAAFPSEAALLVTEVRKRVPEIIVFATDSLADLAFRRAAGSAAEGIKVALVPDSRAYPRAKALSDHLAAAGLETSRAALASYAAVEILQAQSSKDAGEGLAEALAGGTFETILGAIRFDKTGAASVPSYLFYTWDKGELRAPLAP